MEPQKSEVGGQKSARTRASEPRDRIDGIAQSAWRIAKEARLEPPRQSLRPTEFRDIEINKREGPGDNRLYFVK
jgi:hypothetical protein